MVGRRRRALIGATALVAGIGLLAPPVTVQASAPVGSARAVVPGGQSSGDSLFPNQGNTGYDVSHYSISLDARKLPKIKAVTTITARARRALSSFALDLEGLKVSSVRVNGHRARYSRHAAKLVVKPAHPVLGAFTVVVRYAGKPRTHIDPDKALDGWIPASDGATTLNEPVGAMTWFPVNNSIRDKATFSYTVRAAKSRVVAANGELRSKKRHGSYTTWRWQLRQPIAPYLTLVSIGKYRTYASSYRSIDGRTIKVWTFVQQSLGSLSAQRKLLPQILRFHERNFGPYPFRSAGLVVHKLPVGYALETATRPFFDQVPDTGTVVHEQAHQWFGDAVTPCDWGDIWLNEGFATYSEWLWDGAHGGPTPAQTLAALYRDNTATSHLWSPAPAKFSDPADLFGEPVYTRGAMTLQVLREEVGDRDFASILRHWAAQNRSRCVTTKGFIALAERVSGEDLDALFNRWLFVAARPASAS